MSYEFDTSFFGKKITIIFHHEPEEQPCFSEYYPSPGQSEDLYIEQFLCEGVNIIDFITDVVLIDALQMARNHIEELKYE